MKKKLFGSDFDRLAKSIQLFTAENNFQPEPRICTEYVQDMYKGCTRYVQRMYKVRTEDVQGTYRYRVCSKCQ